MVIHETCMEVVPIERISYYFSSSTRAKRISGEDFVLVAHTVSQVTMWHRYTLATLGGKCTLMRSIWKRIIVQC